jgi:hypothetical protein
VQKLKGYARPANTRGILQKIHFLTSSIVCKVAQPFSMRVQLDNIEPFAEI